MNRQIYRLYLYVLSSFVVNAQEICNANMTLTNIAVMVWVSLSFGHLEFHMPSVYPDCSGTALHARASPIIDAILLSKFEDKGVGLPPINTHCAQQVFSFSLSSDSTTFFSGCGAEGVYCSSDVSPFNTFLDLTLPLLDKIQVCRHGVQFYIWSETMKSF